MSGMVAGVDYDEAQKRFRVLLREMLAVDKYDADDERPDQLRRCF